MAETNPVRVFCDGCFDLLHFGHANQLRQAKLMGDILVAGVHSDEQILKAKGPPVFNEQERYRMTRAIKWVDEVAEGVPYTTMVETLDKYNCDFCVHGSKKLLDDVSYNADMVDSFAEVKAAGRFKECERTEGVSTTELVERLLLANKIYDPDKEEAKFVHQNIDSSNKDFEFRSVSTNFSQFYPNAQILKHFSDNQPPVLNDKIVYVCGTFDLFHIGHLCFLEEARKLGDYLIVGIYSDETVRNHIDRRYPIMNLLERVLNVLSYRPVSEVIIGTPYAVTQDLIERFRIDVVAQGIYEDHARVKEEHDPYKVAKTLGIYQLIDSGNNMTTKVIIERVVANRRIYENRNKTKEEKENASSKELEKLRERRNLIYK